MKKKFYLIGLLVLVCAVGLTVLIVVNTKRDDIAPVSGVSAVSNTHERPKMVPVYLYFGNKDKTALIAEIRYIPIEEAAKSTANLATVIMDELIKGPVDSSVFTSVIPEDSLLLDMVSIDHGKAIVNLNTDFVENHPGGKEYEQLTIYSIVNTLTELKDINSVVFLINGEQREEYMGNYRFDHPFPRTAALIREN